MTDETRNPTKAGEQPSYEAPRALRLSDQQRGKGLQVCLMPGTGDVPASCDSTGPTAGAGCNSDGQGAGFSCSATGFGANGSCSGDGSGVF